MIAKKDLIDGAVYEGHCRNASEARWSAKDNEFTYRRRKFGTEFDETINHSEDDDGMDLFFPERLKVENTDQEKNEGSKVLPNCS